MKNTKQSLSKKRKQAEVDEEIEAEQVSEVCRSSDDRSKGKRMKLEEVHSSQLNKSSHESHSNNNPESDQILTDRSNNQEQSGIMERSNATESVSNQIEDAEIYQSVATANEQAEDEVEEVVIEDNAEDAEVQITSYPDNNYQQTNYQNNINKNLKMNQQKKAHAQKAESVSNTDESVKQIEPADEEDPEIPTKDKPQDLKTSDVQKPSVQPPRADDQSENRSTSNKEIISVSQGSSKDISQDYKFEIIELEKHQPVQSSQEDGELINIVEIYYPDKCKVAQRQGNIYLCNQQMFRRAHSDGKVAYLWVLHNLGGQEFFNQPGIEPHYIESGIFESKPGITWQLRLEPGIWPIKTIVQTPAGGTQQQISSKSSKSKIDLIAIPTQDEIDIKKINRRIEVKFSIFQINGDPHSQKDWWREYEYRDDKGEEAHIRYDQFYQFPQPKVMKNNYFSDQFCIQIEILGLVPKQKTPQKMPSPEASDGNAENPDEKQEDQIDKQKYYNFKGLMNEGTTCYLNSVIQALFFIRPFRNAVYKMPTITTEVDPKKLESSIPFCLQRIFYNLQLGNSSFVRTHELLQAFGWNSQDINSQQDVNEFNCILSDQLDKQMQNTPVQGTFNRLFEGDVQNVIKCINVDYESCRDDKFNTIQLRVRGNKTIEESVKSYIKEERLDGQNQYQTDDFGKQDALKFVRFKKLPPVLQISLQRYEYDLTVQQIVKENLKFEFQDVLDLEELLPNPPKGKSDITDTEIVNKYHLHSILVHRGTANAGHYYAFIKPTLEDSWYEFNDAKVQEVGRDYAFGQGIGGHLSSFEFLRQTLFKDSTGQLIERQRENFANAYMLIYVRETEREAIMCDKLSLNEQVPMELQMHFKTEEMFKDTIEQDNDHNTNFGKLHLISSETLDHAKWDGTFLCQKFRDDRQPWKYKFENDQMQHMALYVNKLVSINEFIIMLKERLFPHDDNVKLEDIWLYRFVTTKNQKSNSHFFYTMVRMNYNIEDRWECPLFSARASWTTNDWQQEQKDQTKWRKNMLSNNITRYIVINPAKINPRTGKPYSILKKMNEKETEELQAHYNLFIEYIRKTDMMQGSYYTHMYNNYSEVQYTFQEFPPMKDEPKSETQKSDDQIKEDSNPSAKISENDQVEDKNAPEKDAATATPQNGPGSIFGPIDDIRKSIQKYRDKFIFNYDKDLSDKQKIEYEEFISKQDNQMDLTKEEPDCPKQDSPYYLVFVKIATDYRTVKMRGSLFMRIDQPLDLKLIQKKAGLSDQDLSNYDIFIEPYSNQLIRNYLDQDNKAGLFKPENYLERGLQQIKKNAYDLFKVIPDKIKSVPMEEFLKPTVEGMCLTYILNKQKKVNDNGEEQLVQIQPEFQAHHYNQLLNSVANRGYVKLCYLSDQDITRSSMTEMVLGYHQFYYHESYSQIVQRIARICHEIGLDVTIGSQQNLVNFIQLFDDEIRVVSYHDVLNNPIYAQDNKHVLENIITNSYYLNFTINLLPFNNIDQYAELRFIQFMSDDVISTGKQPYQSFKVSREYNLQDFMYQFQKDKKNQGIYLCMELDRETGTITKIFKEQTPMTSIVGTRKCLSLSNVPTIIRLNEVKNEEVKQINEIIDQFGHQNCCFAFIWIYDQFKKKREQYRQFMVPFNKQNDTFGDIIESTKIKLENMKRKQSNKLELMNIDSLRMWTVKYNNKFVIQKQRVFYLDDFDWRNPMLQYEINQLAQVSVMNMCTDYPNNQNEMFQPYSGNANKNGQGWFNFVYLAAQLTFDEPKEQIQKPKETKRSSAGGFSLGNQN